MCLYEIKADLDKISSMQLWKEFSDEYEQYWNCCQVKKGYSGTAVLTKVKPISVKYELGHKSHDGEGRVITVEFEKFHLVAVYTPNAGEGLKRLSYRTK